MTITYHPDIVQGSPEWHALRCGMLTASEMRLILTPTLKQASNDKERAHVYELAAQRVTGYVEPGYISDAMLRGKEDEVFARAAYADHFAPVTDMGFITNDRLGFTIGCSPDGLVGDDGALECKSRMQKWQMETICTGVMPEEYALQVQTILFVTERPWCDFVSYCAGMPMVTLRQEPIQRYQDAIVDAAWAFEERVQQRVADYEAAGRKLRMIPTERRVELEMHV